MQVNKRAGKAIEGLLREVSDSRETLRLESVKNQDNDSKKCLLASWLTLPNTVPSSLCSADSLPEGGRCVLNLSHHEHEVQKDTEGAQRTGLAFRLVSRQMPSYDSWAGLEMNTHQYSCSNYPLL